MRRKDREITDINEIVDVLRRADTIRVGMFNGAFPYVVPLSFGFELEEQGDSSKIIVYFHGASEGLKNQCIRANGNVCVEADIMHIVQPVGMGITARYESVIGFGTAEEITDEKAKIHGLKKIVEHYGYGDFPVDSCKGLPKTALFKVTLDQITGKRNLPEA